MNFFQRQDEARGKSKLLVALFILGVVGTFLATHALIAALAVLFFNGGANASGDGANGGANGGAAARAFDSEAFVANFVDPRFAGIDFLVVLGIVGLGSFGKVAELKSLGPRGVAEKLGGRPARRSLEGWVVERRLINVVEETAIAAGVPVPPVYVLDSERSINACAIGTSPNDAAIVVTEGALRYLSRDELQGVVAHEFSHIVNADVGLNMRLMGWLFGLQLLAIIGVEIGRLSFETLRWTAIAGGGSRDSDGDGKRDGNITLAFFLLGCALALGLIAIGSIGVFVGNVIRSAVSRQREYLADASAAQFTRNPRGLAGALIKIGSGSVGSKVEGKGSIEAAHLFFASVFEGSFLQSLFRTHPPLLDRIKRLDPNFDGRFPERVEPQWDGDLAGSPVEIPRGVVSSGTIREARERSAQSVFRSTGLSNGFDGNGSSGTVAKGIAVGAAVASAMVDSIGEMREGGLDVAAELLGAIPPEVADATTDADSARAVLCATLLDSNANVRRVQLETLRRDAGAEFADKVDGLAGVVSTLKPATKLSVAALTAPLLKQLDVVEYRAFRKTIVDLCGADGRIDLFEYTVQASVVRDLDVFFRLSRGVAVRYLKYEQIAEPFRVVLSYLAFEGAADGDDAAAKKAFDEGAGEFYVELEIVPREQLSLGAFSRAANELAQVAPALKKKLLTAFYRCVAADGVITEREGALTGALAAALGCPAPDWTRWTKEKRE